MSRARFQINIGGGVQGEKWGNIECRYNSAGHSRAHYRRRRGSHPNAGGGGLTSSDGLSQRCSGLWYWNSLTSFILHIII